MGNVERPKGKPSEEVAWRDSSHLIVINLIICPIESQGILKIVICIWIAMYSGKTGTSCLKRKQALEDK